jgi:hypothetical protein
MLTIRLRAAWRTLAARVRWALYRLPQVEHLRPRADDILLFRVPSTHLQNVPHLVRRAAEDIQRAVEVRTGVRPIVFVLEDSMTLDTLDPVTMRLAGWVRRDG